MDCTNSNTQKHPVVSKLEEKLETRGSTKEKVLIERKIVIWLKIVKHHHIITITQIKFATKLSENENQYIVNQTQSSLTTKNEIILGKSSVFMIQATFYSTASLHLR